MSHEVLKMGHYGAYVWSSYGLTLIAFVMMAVLARAAAKRELRAALRRVQINQANQSSQSSSQSSQFSQDGASS